MKRPTFIARQSSCPTGLLGQLIARVMAAETAEANVEAVGLLELQPHDHVLEVGFGHGRTITRVASLVPAGFVAGIDLSEDMVRLAGRQCRQLIDEKRVELGQGDSLQLPYPDARFDKVYAVHTLYFWRPPEPHLQEIHRVMKVGGRFVLGFTPHDDARTADFPASVYQFHPAEAVKGFLRAAGFEDIRLVVGGTSAQKTLFAVARKG